MTMLGWKEGAIYAALSPMVGRNLVAQARAVRGRLRWERDALHRWRLDQGREMLRHAAARVPLYRERFAAAGFDPARFSSFDELEALPVLSRADLRERGDDLLDELAPPGSMVRTSTGGTTGTPVSVHHDRALATERMLVTHRMYAGAGRPLGAPTLIVAGSPIDARAWTTGRERIKNRLFNVTVQSSFELTPAAIERLLVRLESGRYPWVIAYASVFDLLASASEARGFRSPGLRIVPCAELVSPAQRERWRQVLGAEPFEIYGSRELNSMAGEVPDHRAMMINGDLYHIEIADEAGRRMPLGEPGLITVTTLRERGMPLIRYQLGDVGVIERADPEGPWPFPRLRITHGRALDVICCPDGKLLPGEYFPHLMKEVAAAVERFQVVQTSMEELQVRIVPTASFGDDTRGYLEERIRGKVGPGMRIEVSTVDRIETASSGKYRPTINLVPPEARPGFRGARDAAVVSR